MHEWLIGLGGFAALALAVSGLAAKSQSYFLSIQEKKDFLALWPGAYFRYEEPWRMDLSNAAVPSIPIGCGMEVGMIQTPQQVALSRAQTILAGTAAPAGLILQIQAGRDADSVGPLMIHTLAGWHLGLANTPRTNWGTRSKFFDEVRD